MTTDRDIHDVLAAEADAPVRRTAGWDDIVRRGRHHRRVARVRTGLVAGGVAALGVIGVVAATDLGDDENTGVIANNPDPTVPTVPDPAMTTTTSVTPAAYPPDISGARLLGEFVTVVAGSLDPESGFDPCVERHPRVSETTDEVLVELVPATMSSGQPFVACQSSPFGAWAVIELAAPLNGRRLIDAYDRREIAVVDSTDLLFPLDLPAPFDTAVWEEAGPPQDAFGTIGGWTFSWLADDLVLTVSSWPADGEQPAACFGDPVQVRGVTGELCRDELSLVVGWVEGSFGWSVGVVDIGGNPLSSEIDVVAIADLLQPLSMFSVPPTSYLAGM